MHQARSGGLGRVPKKGIPAKRRNTLDSLQWNHARAVPQRRISVDIWKKVKDQVWGVGCSGVRISAPSEYIVLARCNAMMIEHYCCRGRLAGAGPPA